MKTPLDGIRVIDWTIWQQGPFATALLGDLGAEVIKLETLDGDPGRAIFAVSGATTARNGKNFYFESNNRHKKSITLDMKKPEAREIVYQLVAKSDVFVQNYRKGVAQRLGPGLPDAARDQPAAHLRDCLGLRSGGSRQRRALVRLPRAIALRA